MTAGGVGIMGVKESGVLFWVCFISQQYVALTRELSISFHSVL